MQENSNINELLKQYHDIYVKKMVSGILLSIIGLMCGIYSACIFLYLDDNPSIVQKYIPHISSFGFKLLTMPFFVLFAGIGVMSCFTLIFLFSTFIEPYYNDDFSPVSTRAIKRYLWDIENKGRIMERMKSPQEFKLKSADFVQINGGDAYSGTLVFAPICDENDIGEGIMCSLYGTKGPATTKSYTVEAVFTAEERDKWMSVKKTDKIELPFFRMRFLRYWDCMLPYGEKWNEIANMLDTVCRHIISDIAAQKLRYNIEKRDFFFVRDLYKLTEKDMFVPYFCKGNVFVNEEIRAELDALDKAILKMSADGYSAIEKNIQNMI